MKCCGSLSVPHMSQQLQADNIRVDLQTLFEQAVSICAHVDKSSYAPEASQSVSTVKVEDIRLILSLWTRKPRYC
jgi:hypothetical protein